MKTFLPIKCTEEQYAESMLKKGEICFSCPERWAQKGLNGHIGQGDPEECVFAKIERSDSYHRNIFSLYPNVNIRTDERYVYFKHMNVAMQPAFCYYVLLEENEEYRLTETGKQCVKLDIPGQFFLDFAEGKSREEVLNLPKKNQPAVVIVRDAKEFKKRIFDALKGIGIANEDIITYLITYDSDKCYFYNKEYEAAFTKNSDFRYQNEMRFYIADKNFRRKDIDDQLIITIGNIEDIAEMHCGYYPEGLHLEMMCNVVRKR